MIPTEPIGSIPRPFALITALQRYQAGEIDATILEAAYADAVRSTIAAFEATGSPVITDGEQRKYPNYITCCIHGADNMTPDGFALPSLPHEGRLPRLTRGPFQYNRYADAYLKAALPFATCQMKQTIIAPSTLSLLYPPLDLPDYSRDQFILDLLRAHEREIRLCLEQGAHSVQIDFSEAQLALKIDPTAGLLDTFVDLNNMALEHFTASETARIGVHACFDIRAIRGMMDIDEAGIIPSLFKLRVGRFFIPLMRRRNRRQFLSRIREHLQPGAMIFVGVIDPTDPRVETAEEVYERIVEAAEFIPLQQLGTTDDGGFASFYDDATLSRETAFAKVKARIDGTKLAEKILTS